MTPNVASFERPEQQRAAAALPLEPHNLAEPRALGIWGQKGHRLEFMTRPIGESQCRLPGFCSEAGHAPASTSPAAETPANSPDREGTSHQGHTAPAARASLTGWILWDPTSQKSEGPAVVLSRVRGPHGTGSRRLQRPCLFPSPHLGSREGPL